MKNILFSAVAMTSLGLMSFMVSPKDGVKKVGKHLYEVSEAFKPNSKEAELITATLAKYYKLDKWQALDGQIDFKPIDYDHGWCILKTLGFKGIIHTRCTWNDYPVPFEIGDSKTLNRLGKTLSNYEFKQ
jgi:hypothetical protein